jgi:hypothetical protein
MGSNQLIDRRYLDWSAISYYHLTPEVQWGASGGRTGHPQGPNQLRLHGNTQGQVSNMTCLDHCDNMTCRNGVSEKTCDVAPGDAISMQVHRYL